MLSSRLIASRSANVVVLGCLVPVLIAACHPLGKPVPSPDGIIAITHVSVNDMTSAPASNATVLISGRRIKAVGPSDSVVIPAGVRIIDGTGKFLIPGMWDMHGHVYG